MRSEHPLDRHDDTGSAPRGARTATRVIVLAAVVPLCFAGWLGWQAVAGDGGHDQKASADATLPAAPAGSGGSSAGSPSAVASPSGSGSPNASASPSAAKSAAVPAAGADAAHPLAGKVIVIDPGHNPGNVHYPSKINATVAIGKGTTSCDTTGTATNAGYPEADFTLDVARRVRTILQAEGAKVVFTQDGNLPWGPCVTQRAAIGNAAHADAAISIHGDGAPGSDHGFHVILPAAVDQGGADNRAIVAPSRTLGLDVRAAFQGATGEPYANYISDGSGLDVRSDLGGLNMSKVPKIFIECGNMRNSTDASRMTSASWRQLAAKGIAAGLTAFAGKAR
ncbi:N-acetylmuramoyl-L-alanine amidase [Streptacidiphilus cavernicola]|uniref:N-acetylmuramoyl-L-alanine amidase n=1 Tax=Streptacidiphilus cavernicola TaxID=3342716 RepID=A0ABV6W5S7_9ACTN